MKNRYYKSLLQIESQETIKELGGDLLRNENK